MGMVIYLIVTGVIGLICMGVGAFNMIENWRYGFKDEDVLYGAVLFAGGAFAPIAIPLALIVGPCYGVYKAWAVIDYNIKKSKESK